jgi:hypothetical protein
MEWKGSLDKPALTSLLTSFQPLHQRLSFPSYDTINVDVVRFEQLQCDSILSLLSLGFPRRAHSPCEEQKKDNCAQPTVVLRKTTDDRWTIGLCLPFNPNGSTSPQLCLRRLEVMYTPGFFCCLLYELPVTPP